jgi:hypothetical protein
MADLLDRETILGALARLDGLLQEAGTRAEICLLGGAVMVLAFRARAATKDVDAIFQPVALIRELSEKVAEELNLPAGWLNDGAKGFVSPRHELTSADLPQFDHLHLTAPTAEYLFAMKCLASRLPASESERGDEPDIRFLARHLKLKDMEQAMDLVIQYYPPERVPARTRFLLEDIFSRLDQTA